MAWGVYVLVVFLAFSAISYGVSLWAAAATLIGAAVGIAEIVSRYRDAPLSAVRTPGAALYVFLNGAAAAFAFWFVREYDLPPAGGAITDKLLLSRTMIAGFGAMALFRTSVFNVRIGEQDIAVGPSVFLQVVLSAADRAVDRLRAQHRASSVARIMKGVSFTKACQALPLHCITLMQNLSDADQEQIGTSVKKLSETVAIDEQTKALSLGLFLMNAVGEAVLEEAVNALAPRIRYAQEVALSPVSHVLEAPGAIVPLNVVVKDACGGVLPDVIYKITVTPEGIVECLPNNTIKALTSGRARVSVEVDARSAFCDVTVKPEAVGAAFAANVSATTTTASLSPAELLSAASRAPRIAADATTTSSLSSVDGDAVTGGPANRAAAGSDESSEG